MSHKIDMFDEQTFTRMLRLERKRSDRSGRPFLLLLLNLRTSPGDRRNGHGCPLDAVVVGNVIRSLQDATRETDLAGWYRLDAVIGVIFTEISGSESVRPLILNRVRQELGTRLKAAQLERIDLSLYCYPDPGGQGSDFALAAELYPECARPSAARRLKRGIDVFATLTLLLLFSPLLLLVALAIACTSRGPVLFRQTRIGQYGRPFTFLKFRSMYTNSSCNLHEAYVKKFIASGRQGEHVAASLLQEGLYKIRRDPRVTPLGRLLRRTSVDEIPQLLNVLRGDMSLVGPRPPTTYEYQHYDNWHKVRVRDVKPGITGLWQIKGRSRTTFDEMVRLDLRYVKEWSVWSDIKIMLRTPWAVLTCRGAC